jgi:hypothetical protein
VVVRVRVTELKGVDNFFISKFRMLGTMWTSWKRWYCVAEPRVMFIVWLKGECFFPCSYEVAELNKCIWE